MRLRPKHSQFIASKIARDLANSTFITLPKGKDRVVEVTKMVIDEMLSGEGIKGSITKVTGTLWTPAPE